MNGAREQGQPVPARLGLWDAVSIIIGIVIGTTIFKSPQMIMSNVSHPMWGIGAWALGGALSFIGTLCYAELASTYPRSGGDYVYLSRAYGSWAGFLFGWAQLVVLLTGSIGMMAFVFGDYAVNLWPLPAKTLGKELATALLAVGAVALLSLMNILGVVLGKWTQNLLSLLKVLGLVAIAVVGFRYGQADILAAPKAAGKTSFGMAMIFVLYAYGGWNDAAFVASEVRNRRNILRALLIGIVTITTIYLLVNLAYLQGLGFEGMRESRTVAADFGRNVLGPHASQAISILVMVCALGAINGLIFTGSRVYSTLGGDYDLFALLGRWNRRLGSPVWAILIQALVAIAMVGFVGLQGGRDAIDWCMTQAGLEKMPWDDGGFETLLSGTAPVFWGFFLLSGLSLFALRQRDQGIQRPFSVPLFPLVPLIFCGTCGYMLYSAIAYAKYIALIGLIPLVIGLPLYALSRRLTPEEGVIEKMKT